MLTTTSASIFLVRTSGYGSAGFAFNVTVYNYSAANAGLASRARDRR